jgi:calcineurin-like phosphoesterase
VTFVPSAFEVAEGDVRLGGAIVDVDPATGQARQITRVMVRSQTQLPDSSPDQAS